MSMTPRTDDAQWGTGKVTTDFARTLEHELASAKAEIAALKEDIAMRLEQTKNALTERDRYKAEAERKRILAREFESLLGFTEAQAREEGAIEDAVKRIHALKANQCETEPAAWKHVEAFYFCTAKSEAFQTEPLFRKAKP